MKEPEGNSFLQPGGGPAAASPERVRRAQKGGRWLGRRWLQARHNQRSGFNSHFEQRDGFFNCWIQNIPSYNPYVVDGASPECQNALEPSLPCPCGRGARNAVLAPSHPETERCELLLLHVTAAKQCTFSGSIGEGHSVAGAAGPSIPTKLSAGSQSRRTLLPWWPKFLEKALEGGEVIESRRILSPRQVPSQRQLL